MSPIEPPANPGKTKGTSVHEKTDTQIRTSALHEAVMIEHELPAALMLPTDDLNVPDHMMDTYKPSAADADQMNDRARRIECATLSRVLRNAQVFERFIRTGFTDEDLDRAELLAALQPPPLNPRPLFLFPDGAAIRDDCKT